jgi:hypothetical protein
VDASRSIDRERRQDHEEPSDRRRVARASGHCSIADEDLWLRAGDDVEHRGRTRRRVEEDPRQEGGQGDEQAEGQETRRLRYGNFRKYEGSDPCGNRTDVEVVMHPHSLSITASIELPEGLGENAGPWKHRLDVTIDRQGSLRDGVLRMGTFTEALWKHAQGAMISSIVAAPQRPVQALRVELRARSESPRLRGSVSLRFDQRIESAALEFTWRSSLDSATQSETNTEVRVQGPPAEMIEAFQKAIGAEIARWLSCFSFNEDRNEAHEEAAMSKPNTQPIPENLVLMKLSAEIDYGMALPAEPGQYISCNQTVIEVLDGRRAIESQLLELESFRRAVMLLFKRGIKLSGNHPDKLQRMIPVVLTLKCGNGGDDVFYESMMTLGPSLDKTGEWRLRFTAPHTTSEDILSEEVGSLLEEMKQRLVERTAEWFSHVTFCDDRIGPDP